MHLEKKIINPFEKNQKKVLSNMSHAGNFIKLIYLIFFVFKVLGNYCVP